MSIVPELGHFALLLGLPTAVALALVPLIGQRTANIWLMRSGRVYAVLLCILLVLSFVCLTHAFLTDDFSLLLVAKHSNSALPEYYKVSAVWGNHEGSLLLWVLILALWTLAVAFKARQLPADIHALVLSVLGMITIGFMLFIIFTSNPFERNLISPALEGNDLNPLLQDIGLILHPPMLYLGYVGFSVAFAFAIAALITGRVDADWARWCRPWTNTAWAFLTIGIALGSWWAYYELGWGGWWFWDPVENASLMPWLAGTALIHSLASMEKRGVFHSWTLLLAILAFSLSLLGTFLVRSGILVSVHAFASDPSRGMFILAFLTLVIGGSLLLFALRAPARSSAQRFKLLSRETALLINNILLVIVLAIVLLGTLFPLIASALDLGSYSVGPPYFNSLIVPLMLPFLLALSIAPYLYWRQSGGFRSMITPWLPVFIVSILMAALSVAVLGRIYGVEFSWLALVSLVIALLLALMTALHPWWRHRKSLHRLSMRYWGMLAAHFGVAVCAAGIALTSVYSVQRDVRMEIDDTVVVAGLQFQLRALEQRRGPNYTATRASVEVYRVNHLNDSGERTAGSVVTTIYPEKRLYHAGRNVMTEAGIDAGLSRDLYVSLGEPLGDGAWAVRVYIKAFVRLIWLGSLFMAAGALMALIGKRAAHSVQHSSLAAASA